ncbi:S8 family serine peptidase [Nocardioides sp. CER19]|uniref:S8 family serine peptidase n=1 Tax=Nocardioides sp. CER19 TaxID=3038538 RepID=UPI002449AF94|nr:S8 family serine peptidase [Nocardioides sp. CER19]MDH2413742.1 S8 family serine peptidase [Nocardioides sp. CER19]
MAAAALIGGALVAAPLTPGASAAPATQKQAALVKALGLGKDVRKSGHDAYVVLLKSDPLLAEFDQDQLATSAARDAQGAILDAHTAIADDADVSASAVTQDLTVAANAFAVNVDHAAAVRLAADPKVAAVVPDELFQATGLTAAAPAAPGRRTHDRSHTVLPTHPRGHGRPGTRPPYHPGPSSSVPTEEDFLDLTGHGEAYDSGIDGTGVLVGVIDTGIWPEHPSFADDGTLPAAPVLAGDSCQFGNTSANPDDKDFTCNDKLVGARDMTKTYRAVEGAEPDEFVSARDDEGHGTHTASTAAGDANVKAFIKGKYVDTTSGIAPRAQVIAYKALGNQGGFSSDLSAAIDQAVADGVDVINYSIGGGANLTGVDAISFLFASDAGVFSAVSAGNDGPDPETIGGPSDVPWVTSVAAGTETRFYQGTVQLGNGKRLTGASIGGTVRNARIVDAATLGNAQCDPEKQFSSSVAGAIVICTRGLPAGRVATSLAVKNAGGLGEILANVDTPDQDNLFTDNFWVPTVHMDQKVADRARAYVAGSHGRATASIVHTGSIVKQPWKAPSVTVFSSRGPSPTAASIIKPDITAPGIQVLAGASPFTDEGFVQGELFQAIAGTSMSSPQIAGMYALVKQAHPDWSQAEAKSALQTSASLDITSNDRKTPANPFERGAGEVNPGVVSKPGMFQPGLVYDAGFNDYLAFLCGAAPGSVSAATCSKLSTAGFPTRTEDLNLATIGIQSLVGNETVKRTVTNVSSRSITVTADTGDAPDGYTMSVSPRTLTVPAGGKASFEVTIANNGAPVGAWRFGNLTWRGSGYSVNSTIAVRGASIGAPATVTGSGASGTVDVPVKFGYDGAYQAVPAGLVASRPLTGTVLQDPDQTFGTPDDTQGGVTKVPVTIGDTSYWRIQYVKPGNDDIDLYLLDSAGKVVARSTAGGTDELIELSHPAAGSYTLAVHGWQVTGTHTFSIDNWVVPTGAGTLKVDSAPTTATVAGTGTVTLSWTGATPAGTYYGAVDHTDGTNRLGQTIVKVSGTD